MRVGARGVTRSFAILREEGMTEKIYLRKAVIFLENTQIRRYTLEPAGTFFFRRYLMILS